MTMDKFKSDDPLNTITWVMVTQDPDPTVPLVVSNATTMTPTKLCTQPVVEHEYFNVLLDRGKGSIGKKNEQIKLIHYVLKMHVSN